MSTYGGSTYGAGGYAFLELQEASHLPTRAVVLTGARTAAIVAPSRTSTASIAAFTLRARVAPSRTSRAAVDASGSSAKVRVNPTSRVDVSSRQSKARILP